jgi:glycine/D-amino acid oxidase-like deaminating enzyme
VQVTSFRVPADFPDPRLVSGDNVLGCYIRPEGHDLLLVGTRSQPGALPVVDPDASDTRVDEARVLRATEALCTRYPAMADGKAMGGYTSMYDMTPDGHFILEATPGRAGLFTAAGFSGHGFKHSPVVGRAMADLVADGRTSEIDLSPFSSARFTDGRSPLRGSYKRSAF